MFNIENYYHNLGIYLYLLPIISNYWAAYALFANKYRTRSQLYLAISLTILGVSMTFNFWYDRFAATSPNEVIRSINPILTVFCTISVLMYFVSLIQPYRLTRRFIIYHILPAVIFSVILLIFEGIYHSSDFITGWDDIKNNLSHPIVILRIAAIICVTCFETYVFLYVLRMYMSHRKYIKNSYSYSENIDLSWVLHILILFGIFAVCDLVWVLNSNIHIKAACDITAFIVICRIFWLGSRQDEVPIFVDENTRRQPYQKNPEDIDNILIFSKYEILKKALLNYFETEMPYLNPNLSLSDVAEALHTNKTYLSQMINSRFDINFYTFVNRYRIKYIISLIEISDKNITVDNLFNRSGFKTRSVFYKQFKEETGLSPLNYIKRNKE